MDRRTAGPGSGVPPLHFTHWQWLALTLTAPVVVWGDWPIHTAAVAGLRHRSATMDTLVSVGVLAAFGWSLYTLCWGVAGYPGGAEAHTGGDPTSVIHLEVAAGIVTFILVGRQMESRARHRAGSALRSLLALGAAEVTILRPGPDGGETERRVPVARGRGPGR